MRTTKVICLVSLLAISTSWQALAECPSELTKVEKAVRSGSLQEAEAAAQAVGNSGMCEVSEQEAADAYLSQAQLQQARKIDPALRDARAAALVQQAAGRDKYWRAWEAQGRIQRSRNDFRGATESFQSAINLIALASNASAGPWKNLNLASAVEIAALAREADEAKHLAASGPQAVLVTAKPDRAGNPGGVFSAALNRGAVGVRVPAPILFEYDSAALTKMGEDAAKELTEYLRKQKPNVITVVGHTDHAGSEAYNLDLSKRRAAAVVEFLKGQNISARMTAIGKGFSEPRKLSEDTTYTQAQIDQLNRRVEFDWNR
ncbi:OmpA family protein [Bradyrhizobium japonicum]|uniref:OmpA family protein n=1 Tax=Bradyrhizobium japonicum TaxID=375 RepID=UPI001BA969E3|nr:OmpA family protein [Bradyrhizobium japonicum]MBR0749990.1 OmpA family protein [Bradyrhizobium japonicum]